MLIVFRNLLLVCEAFLQTSYPLKKLGSGQCEVLGKSRSLLGFQPPTPFHPLQDPQSLKGFQSKAFRHFVKMSDREFRTHQLGLLCFLIFLHK
jgi:hypothetical protein